MPAHRLQVNVLFGYNSVVGELSNEISMIMTPKQTYPASDEPTEASLSEPFFFRLDLLVMSLSSELSKSLSRTSSSLSFLTTVPVSESDDAMALAFLRLAFSLKTQLCCYKLIQTITK